MKKLLLVMLVFVPLVGCDSFGDVDPIETACALCAALNDSGICEMTDAQAKDFAGCGPSEEVFIKVEGEKFSLQCVEPK